MSSTISASAVLDPSYDPTQKKLIGTHSGTFHADEALAVWMLRGSGKLEEWKEADLVRTRDQAVLDKCSIVVDVGAVYDSSIHRYDHHQRTFSTTYDENHRTKLSSAGLIYKHFGNRIIKGFLEEWAGKDQTTVPVEDRIVQLLKEKMYDVFVEALDAIDNGISQYELGFEDENQGGSEEPPAKRVKREDVAKLGVKLKKNYQSGGTDLSSRVAHLNAPWNVSPPPTPSDIDARFLRASTLMGSEFSERLEYFATSWLPAREIVENAYNSRILDGRVIVFSQFCPWKDHLHTIESEHPGSTKPLYVLYADDTTSPDPEKMAWRIQAVPKEEGTFENRKGLPVAWRGLRDEALSQLSGVEGCIFCHASGFIGGNKSKAGILKMAELAVQEPDT